MPIDECQELKNIKYKTMLLSGNKNTLSTVIRDISNLDILLDEENAQSKKESWNKLDKSIKINKINNYINKLSNEYKLSNEEGKNLLDYLSNSLDKKNLQRNKDVQYIKETGTLESIPNLHFNNTTRKFTLRKNTASNVSKSLGPTRKKKTSPKIIKVSKNIEQNR